MTILFAIAVLFIAVIVHELGHAYAMRKLNVPIESILIGVPISFLPIIRFTDNKFFKCKINISPILLGGAVTLTKEGNEKIANFNYANKAIMYGSGIWANILFALIVFSCPVYYKIISNLFNISNYGYLIFGGMSIAITLLSFLRKQFCAYILPILSIIIFCTFFYSIFSSFAKTDDITSSVQISKNVEVSEQNITESRDKNADSESGFVGPIGIVKLIIKKSDSALSMIIIIGFISLVMGLCNSLPFEPLDGGMILGLLIKKFDDKVYNYYKLIGITTFICFAGYALISDVVGLF